MAQELAGLAGRLGGIAWRTANQRIVLLDRERLADEVTLHGVASLFSEETELFLGFHAFGDDRHFKTVTEANDRAHDRRRLRIASKIHDKGAVDLDLVERERLQIAQRGVAAAEIVHREFVRPVP